MRIGSVVFWEALKPCATVVAPRPYILIDQLNPIMFMVSCVYYITLLEF